MSRKSNPALTQYICTHAFGKSLRPSSCHVNMFFSQWMVQKSIISSLLQWISLSIYQNWWSQFWKNRYLAKLKITKWQQIEHLILFSEKNEWQFRIAFENNVEHSNNSINCNSITKVLALDFWIMRLLKFVLLPFGKLI